MTRPVTTRTLLASINRGEFDTQLDALNEVVSRRLETVRTIAIEPGGLARIEGVPEGSALGKYNALVLRIETVTPKTVNGTLLQSDRRVSIPTQYVVPHLRSAQAERRERDAAVKDEVRKSLTKKRVVRRREKK